MEQRNLLRTQMRTRRQQLSRREQQLAADGFVRILCQWRGFRSAHRIAFYYPNDGELDIRPAMQQAQAMAKRCYLPIVVRFGEVLRFGRYRRGQAMRPNRFGIPEPVTHPQELISANKLNLVIVPLVAFDRDGGRLGMGAGYYDRTMAFLLGAPSWRPPDLVGAAYSFQQTAALPQRPWDVPLRAIATETSLIMPGRQQST